MKLLSASLLFGCTLGTPTITQWQFEIEDTVYEALVHPVPRGFWESKAFCDGLGAGWQLPIPSNDAEVSFMFKSRVTIGVSNAIFRLWLKRKPFIRRHMMIL